MSDTIDETGAQPADPPAIGPAPRLGAGFAKLFSATVISNIGDGMSQVAYPWLASAVTRNPMLVALVAVAQRLPWLIFTLPAGVITDRVDRRKAIVTMDALRAVFTLVVAFAVLGRQSSLPKPDQLDLVIGTRTGLYLVVLTATLLLGMAEVLRDNSAQTILPDIVPTDQLERANGRMWSIEAVANQFIGPPLGSILLIAAFSIPFFIDAASFFVAAALVAAIPGTFRATRQADLPPSSFRTELAEGVRWLWAHPLLRPMAIILGLMNLASMVSGATFVLFAQEVLGVGPLLFTVIGFGGAIGGLLGGNLAPRIARRWGSGTSLFVSISAIGLALILTGVVTWWPVTLVLFSIEALFGILWNVITVSLRQAIIPPHLLGRVNSVYRFFAWGMIPIGAAIGGVFVFVVERLADRDLALRGTYVVAGAIYLGLLVFCRAALTTEQIDRARSQGA